MTWYTVYNDATGKPRLVQSDPRPTANDGETILETAFDPRDMDWSETTRTYSVRPPPPRLYDQRDFIGLFTAQEFASIADSTNANVRYFYALITTGSRPIVLARGGVVDERIANGFPLLVALGHLTAERATAIRTALGI